MATNLNSPLALLMTYANPDEENRLKTQLTELLRMGYEVHTLGFGIERLHGVAQHFSIPKRQNLLGLVRVALIHLLFVKEKRFHALRVPRRVLNELEGRHYDLVITHDLELLPFLLHSPLRPSTFFKSVKHIDLHELHEFRSPMSGIPNFFWRLLRFRLKPYHDWLMTFLQSKEVDLITVVNRSIGEWYRSNGHIKSFLEVMNAAPELEVAFQKRSTERLRLIYHGRYGKSRGLEKVVEASACLREGDSLHFMLTGAAKELEEFKSFARATNPSITFHNSVAMSEVARYISQFDVEVIYFEPLTNNLLLTLPNKFFEAVQGRLAIISGPSPELVRFTSTHGNGRSTADWGPESLSEMLSGLDRQNVEEMREASHALAQIVNSTTEAGKLHSAWKNLVSAKRTSQR